MDYAHRFGIRLRKLRQALGLSQEQLAERIDVSPETISNLERGVHAPTFARLAEIAQGLEVDLPELFRDLPEK